MDTRSATKSTAIGILRERELLNGASSTKRTYHVVLEASLTFQPGDSVAIAPHNDPLHVAEFLSPLGIGGATPIVDHRKKETLPLIDYIAQRANLDRSTPALLSLLLEHNPSLRDHDEVAALLHTADPDQRKLLFTALEPTYLLSLCRILPTPQEIAQTLAPLLPRYYSIASSPLVHPNELHLTVALTEYEKRGRLRRGVASNFLCYTAQQGAQISCSLQPSRHFYLPEEDKAPMVMIGPGTGIAPFRAFLQHRHAQQAAGNNWLFFGERHEETDFYYRDFWLQLVQQGRLRLDTAFSRDTEHKTYVQHRMWDQRTHLWEWIQQGAYLYICGEAEPMAQQVETTLLHIAQEAGGHTPEHAHQWLRQMRQSKRLRLDVY